ncbi:hypothetical protein Sa4125_20260 [Aureimonas sp. SA4125]|uniref:hypothetical protein n=1 Tax=Aureimonas sp. SA4125 TaxID=2826993 RepID=UPI001CC75172|nr:hypothetical protein [Aureimonas sp. SA4125]BDA84484.1 hypothetical protein Sa4125_20260 [Aureimonas sp. SA4125]
MPRMMTTVTLACWLGYCAVASLTSGFAALDGAMGSSLPMSFLAPSSLPASFVGDVSGAAALLAVAALLAFALFTLHAEKDRQAIARAEWLGIGGLVLATVAILTGAGHSHPVSDSTAIALLAVSIMAIAVDRLITVEEEEEDKEAFEAGIAAISQAMARQTQLYTPSHLDRSRR